MKRLDSQFSLSPLVHAWKFSQNFLSRRVLSSFLLSFCSLGLSQCGGPWMPTGGWQAAVSPQCEAHNLEHDLVAPGLTSANRLQIIRDFLSRCESEISRGSVGAYHELIRYTAIRYDYMKQKNAMPLEWLGMDGIKIRLELFMKQDDMPRPLVIVKCGLQCDAGSTTLGIMLMNLYDEGPFHVLLVPSITGEGFQRDNGVLALGGYDEGRQLLRLAKWVQSSGFKYSSKVSEVHVVGMSLGGHAALYSALYASHNRKPSGDSYVKSVFAGCPVVDLKPSLDRLYGGGIISHFFRRFFLEQLLKVGAAMPIVREVIGDINHPNDAIKDIPALVTRGAIDYYKRSTKDPKFNEAPFVGYQIKNEEDFWKVNSFQDFSDDVNVDVYAWAAENDKVVHSDMNAEKLVGRNTGHFNVLVTPKGSHCMFFDAYSWKTSGAIMRGLLLAHSNHFIDQRRSHLTPLYLDNVTSSGDNRGDENWFAADSHRTERAVQWRANVGSSQLDLIAYGRRKCLIEHHSDSCEKGYSVAHISMDALGIDRSEIPTNEVEAQALTRWLNSVAWVWGAERGVLKASEEPRQVEWSTFGAIR